MRKITFSAMLGLMLFSCSKSDVNETIQPNVNGAVSTVNAPGTLNVVDMNSPDREGEECVFTSKTVNLMAGQTMLAGNITTTNDGVNLTVTYNTNPGWNISQVHLYVGEYALAPINNGGNPQPGRFPYDESFNPKVTTYSTTIPLSTLPDCFIIAAHSVVHNFGGSGGTQTGWGQGTGFPGNNWGMYFDYCVETCE